MIENLCLLLTFSLALAQALASSGTVSGVVTRADTTPPRPLVNARVDLLFDGPSQTVWTDASGNFLFTNVGPGSVRLHVTRDGCLRQDYPSSGADRNGRAIRLSAGQTLSNIHIEMDSAPTITGTIRDERNAPTSGVVVQALRRGYDTKGNRTLRVLASTLTDDHGLYRLYWLDPGEYLIAANQPGPVRTGTADVGTAAISVPTYFPNGVDPDDAKPVALESGRDIRGLDFQLVRQPAASITGTVTSLTAGPVNATVSLLPESGETAGRFSTVAQRGAFAFKDVPPGTYLLTGALGTESGTARVRMRARDLSVRLEIGPGVALSGRIHVAANASVDFKNLTVAVVPSDPALPGPFATPVRADGQFSMSGLQPGYFEPRVEGLAIDQYLKAARYASVDALQQAFPVAYGPPGLQSELELEIGTDGARIEGAVYDRNNTLTRNAQVLLVPESQSRARFDLYKATPVGADGTFTFTGIPPGDYKVFAWDQLEPHAFLNTDFLRPFEDLGIRVHLEPLQATPIALRLIETLH